MSLLLFAASTEHQTDRGDAGQDDADPADDVGFLGFALKIPHFDLASTSLLPPVIRSARSQCLLAAVQLQR